MMNPFRRKGRPDEADASPAEPAKPAEPATYQAWTPDQPADAAPPAPGSAAAPDTAPDTADQPEILDHALGPAIIAALRSVYDPEIPVSIYDLGLIYKVDISERNDVAIEMTLTAPGCPVAGEMPGMVQQAVSGQVEGIGAVEVEIVWEPPWSPDLMSEAARLELGFM